MRAQMSYSIQLLSTQKPDQTTRNGQFQKLWCGGLSSACIIFTPFPLAECSGSSKKSTFFCMYDIIAIIIIILFIVAFFIDIIIILFIVAVLHPTPPNFSNRPIVVSVLQQLVVEKLCGYCFKCCHTEPLHPALHCFFLIAVQQYLHARSAGPFQSYSFLAKDWQEPVIQ